MAETRGNVLEGAGLMLAYAMLIGLADNALPGLSRAMSLWQFLALRAAIALMLLGGFLALRPALRHRLRPLRPRAVILRAVVHAGAIACFYGAMGFLTPAQAWAGLLTAPIFAVAFEAALGRRLPGLVAVTAAICGFVGVLLGLPGGAGGLVGPGTGLGLLAGALYAVSNMMAWRVCRDEHPLTLTATYIAATGIIGSVALLVLPAAAGGFLTRAPVWPGPADWAGIAGHAVATLIGVSLMLGAYQRMDAARAGALHYVCLPVACGWSWLLWGWLPGPAEWLGMGLIVAAGMLVLAENGRRLGQSAGVTLRRRICPARLSSPPQAAFFWPAKRS